MKDLGSIPALYSNSKVLELLKLLKTDSLVMFHHIERDVPKFMLDDLLVMFLHLEKYFPLLWSPSKWYNNDEFWKILKNKLSEDSEIEIIKMNKNMKKFMGRKR